MKKCKNCGVESDNFGPTRKNTDGLHSWCRICCNKKVREYFKTKDGVCSKIYSSQRATSRKRGYKMPDYSLDEFREWLLSQENFNTLYNSWVKSGYNKNLTPSVDRLDDYKSYSFDNIQLISWEDNRNKIYSDMKNGINNKQSKAVIGVHKITGEEITFYSGWQAGRKTGIYQGSISACCNGKCKSAGGYYWKYIN